MSLPIDPRDSAEEIAEQITEVIAEERAKAQSEIIESQREIEILTRLDALDSRLADIDARTQVPAPAADESVTEAVAEIRDIAETIAETVAEKVENPVDSIEEIEDDFVDTIEDLPEDVAPKNDKKPARTHGLFRRWWGGKSE